MGPGWGPAPGGRGLRALGLCAAATARPGSQVRWAQVEAGVWDPREHRGWCPGMVPARRCHRRCHKNRGAGPPHTTQHTAGGPGAHRPPACQNPPTSSAGAGNPPAPGSLLAPAARGHLQAPHSSFQIWGRNREKPKQWPGPQADHGQSQGSAHSPRARDTEGNLTHASTGLSPKYRTGVPMPPPPRPGPSCERRASPPTHPRGWGPGHPRGPLRTQRRP